MLRIRLQRKGRTKVATYRIIVAEHARSAKKGHAVEELGSYDPRTKNRVLNADRVKYWISKGAQPSDTMHNMLVSAGVISGKKINVLPKKTVAKKEEEVSAQAVPAAASAAEIPAQAPTETPTETPTEEAPQA